MGAKRRYRLGSEKESVYHAQFDKLRVDSQILNGGSMPLTLQTVFWDKQALLHERMRLVGTSEGSHEGVPEGMYYSELARMWLPAKLTYIKKKLDEIENAFKRFQTRKVNQGFEKPTKWPSDLYEKRLKWEAEFDVRTEELEAIDLELQKAADVQTAIDDKNILRYGLTGSSKTDRDEFLREIHGQRVMRRNDGMLLIANGPYAGMAVSDYRKLSAAWCAERRAKRKAAQDKRAKEIKEQGYSYVTIPSIGTSVIPASQLPAWPNWAKKYDLKPVPKELVEDKEDAL